MAMVGSITRGEIMGVPGTDLFNTKNSENKNMSSGVRTQTITLEEESERNDVMEEGYVDYSERIRESAFVGEVPFDAIMEGLEDQFDDYINMEDKVNYVDVFYDQLHASYEALAEDDEAEHPDTINEILDELHTLFTEKMAKLFEENLTLTFPDITDNSGNRDDIEFLLRRMYEFFILGARENFKTVIAFDVLPKTTSIPEGNHYFAAVQELVNTYSPIITTLGPIEFLRYRNDAEIIELFENGQVVGNFLRKYSPKFYQNEEFLVDVINHTTMVRQFKTDVLKSAEGFSAADISQEVKESVNTATKNYLEMVRETVCPDDDDSHPAVYEYGENYEHEYEVGPYKD